MVYYILLIQSSAILFLLLFCLKILNNKNEIFGQNIIY